MASCYRLLVTVLTFTFGTLALSAPTVDWTVNEIDLGIANEGRAYSFSLGTYVRSTTGAAIKFSATGLPSWLTLDASGKLSGTPTRADVGRFDGIEFAVNSGSSRAVTRGRGEVVKTTRAPRWTSKDITLPEAREGFSYSQSLGAWIENTEKAPLRFEVVSNTPPSWMGVSSTTGALFGTPTRGSAGDVQVRVKLTAILDGIVYADTALLRLKVTAVNRAPRWRATPLVLPGALSNRRYEQMLAASVVDADGDAVTFKLQAGPAWGTITAEGLFAGTPGLADAGLAQWTVRATDAQGATADNTVRVAIAKTNEAPAWQARVIALADARESAPYNIDLSKYLSDVDGDLLTFTLLSGPDWITLGAGGTLLGVPTRDDVGAVKLTVRASDGKGGLASADFSFFVLPENHAPEWVLNPIFTKVREGQDVRLDLAPYVRETDAEALTFSVVQTAGWGTLSSAGVFTAKAEARFVGRSTFQFRVTDSQGAGANVTVKIDVEAVNHAPVWTLPRLPDATEGALYQSSLAAFAADPDGDALVFEKVGSAPAWLSLTAAGNVSGTPAFNDVGPQNVRARATDKHGESAEIIFSIQVNGVNHAPRWRQTAPLFLGEAFEGATFSFNLATYASDPDGDALVFDLVKGPAWMTVAADGKVGGRPTRADVGPFQAVLRVRDAARWIDIAAEGTVRRRNQAPVVRVDWPVFQVKERETFKGNLNEAVHVTDADGDTLTFYLKTQVPWIHLATDGSFTLSPRSSDRGAHAYAISIDDGTDSVLGALRVEVLANARPPVWSLNPIARLATTNEVFSGSLVGHVQDLDAGTLGFVKKAGRAWLTVASDGRLEGIPSDSDVGMNSFTVAACNADRQCADAVLNIDVQKGLAADRWRLADKTPGAAAEVVWALDPSTASKPLVGAVRGALADFASQISAAGVSLQQRTLDTTHGEYPPDGVQSPLWTLYGVLTTTTSPGKTPPAILNAMVVSRQTDGLRWFADRSASHRGTPADAYWATLRKKLEARGQALRVSAIAPSCPALGHVNGVTALPVGSYKTWVQETGGSYVDDKCKLLAKEWMVSYAQEVAWRAQATAKKVLALSRQPAGSSYLDVSVGGTSLPRGAVWEYDAATNTVAIDWSKVDLRSVRATDYLQVRYPASTTAP